METITHPLNTHNPESITYKHEQLYFTLLGGVRLEGLDRLRVTIKTEYRDEAIRHNLDLYNDSQTEKYIKKTAERLGIGITYISKALAELISEVEAWRMQEIARQEIKQEKKKILSAEERTQAEAFLKQKDLLERTAEYIGQSGVIGEEHNRLLMYLIFTSRKTSRPLHIISLGSSGAGKSHLQEKVSELIPEEDKIEITSLTGNAFYYFDESELGHKLILIEDLDGAEAALYPIRELQSKQKLSKTLTIKDKKGNAKTIHLTVRGPVTISGCTTRESIYEDNANRSFLIYLNESSEQDEHVMDYQRKLSAGKINQYEQRQIRELLKNTQRILQPLTVINPYAEYLKIPQEVFKPRRTNAHYIAFIEAVTFYKQYQREKKTDRETGEQYIETTLEDIAEANQLMKEILLRKSDQLSGACRTYFEKLKNHLQEKKQTKFANKEIRQALRENASNQKRYMIQLQEQGYVKKNEGDKKKGFLYEVVSFKEYEQLQSKISNVLDEILSNLKEREVQQFKEVHKGSEPLKAKPGKGKSKKFTEKQDKTKA
jgi:hypothetical protein